MGPHGRVSAFLPKNLGSALVLILFSVLVGLLHYVTPAESYCISRAPALVPSLHPQRPLISGRGSLPWGPAGAWPNSGEIQLPQRVKKINLSASNGPSALQNGDHGSTGLLARVQMLLLKIRLKGKLKRERGMARTPFQEYVKVRSVVRKCLMMIAAYLAVGSVAYRFVLERGSWTLIDSIYFCVVTFLTAGFGDLVPSTHAAKIFTIFYSLSGVSIIGAAIGVIWKNVLETQERAVSKAQKTARVQVMHLFVNRGDDGAEEDEEMCIDDDYIFDEEQEGCCMTDEGCILVEDEKDDSEPLLLEWKATTLRGTIVRAMISQFPTLLTLIFLGTLLGRAEGWSVFQTLYYGVSAATTIGYGDVVAQSQVARLLAVIFLPLSVFSLGEILSSCAGFQINKAVVKAEKAFMRRGITSNDLIQMDVNRDGEVDEADFMSFMLVAMNKVDQNLIDDLKRLFRALDVGKDGFLRTDDLIILAQRKLNARRLRRKARTKVDRSRRGS